MSFLGQSVETTLSACPAYYSLLLKITFKIEKSLGKGKYQGVFKLVDGGGQSIEFETDVEYDAEPSKNGTLVHLKTMIDNKEYEQNVLAEWDPVTRIIPQPCSDYYCSYSRRLKFREPTTGEYVRLFPDVPRVSLFHILEGRYIFPLDVASSFASNLSYNRHNIAHRQTVGYRRSVLT